LYVTGADCGNTAERIDLQSGVETLGNPKENASHGRLDLSTAGKARFDTAFA